MQENNTAPCPAYDWNTGRRPRKYYTDIGYLRRSRGRGLTRYETAEKYKQALHTIHIIKSRLPKSEEISLRAELREQINRWKAETRHWSSVTKMVAHPSYLRIIGLSHQLDEYETERTLLRELETEPDHWFAALMAITGDDPTLPEQDFDESVDSWLDWGRAKGII
jgi:hypothetical protein